jgi:excisionase family DNA binding protein
MGGGVLKTIGIDWGREDRLGKLPDSKLAEILGVSRQAVSQGRTKLGIPAYKPEPESRAKVEAVEAEEIPEEAQAGEVEETSRHEADKEERRKKARREAQKVAATLEGTAKAADPAEVEVARGIVADMLSAAAVAVALGTTKFTVQRYIREKKLHAVKVGGAWKIPVKALEKFLSGE